MQSIHNNLDAYTISLGPSFEAMPLCDGVKELAPFIGKWRGGPSGPNGPRTKLAQFDWSFAT